MPKIKIKKPKLNFSQSDTILFNVVLIVLCFGLVMCFSASAPSAQARMGDSYYYLKKQLIWAVIGLVVMAFTTYYPYKNYKKYSMYFYIITCVLLAITLAMPPINGARRWIGIGGLSIQPSEVAKIVLIIVLSDLLSRQKWDKGIYKNDWLVYRDFLKYFLIMGIFAIFLIFEPHFSCIILLFGITCILLFVSGARMTHFFVTLCAAVPLLAVFAFKESYRLSRITTFIDPFKDPQGEGYQIIQSLYAIGSGGLFGLGLGQSRQKYLYIPEPQNDFIFSIICEEMGFIGAVAVIILFLILIWRGITIAVNTKDKFGSLLATGITALIAIQFILNVAVVTSSIPVTGMPLPFFSAGGSSLVFIMASMGILLNISKSMGD